MMYLVIKNTRNTGVAKWENQSLQQTYKKMNVNGCLCVFYYCGCKGFSQIGNVCPNSTHQQYLNSKKANKAMLLLLTLTVAQKPRASRMYCQATWHRP